MKKLLLALLLLIASLSYGQARIGYSKQDIRREFASQGITDVVSSDGTKFLMYDSNDDVRIAYYFNEDNICTRTYVMTKSKSVAGKIMQLYDNVYNSVNSYQWRAIVGDGVLFVEFSFDTEYKLYMFQWYANN